MPPFWLDGDELIFEKVILWRIDVCVLFFFIYIAQDSSLVILKNSFRIQT